MTRERSPETALAQAGLLDSAPCGFLSFGDDGVVRIVNRTLLDMLGQEREDVLGRHVENLMSVGSRIFYQTHLFPLIRMRGGAEEIFVLLRTKGGEEVGVLLNAVRNTRDGAVANDCVLVRVRERQKYEQELLSARRVAEQARTVAEARGQELEDANQQLESQALELELQQEQLIDQAHELQAATDELQEVNESLRERNEEALRLQAEAEKANRAKSEFLAMMSHELRTPLNAISGYVQLLEMGVHGPVTDKQREALDRIDRSQRHLLRLINDILNLARVESGRLEYDISDVALQATIDEVVPMVEPQLADKQLHFVVNVAGDPVARGDKDKMQQVLLNLLSNAVKFTEEGGRIELGAAAEGEHVVVRVIDTGAGIPTEKLDSIFDPFVQVDSGHQRQGTGLGLAISRDLARGMDGDLSAESVVGDGSTFTFTLPAASGA